MLGVAVGNEITVTTSINTLSDPGHRTSIEPAAPCSAGILLLGESDRVRSRVRFFSDEQKWRSETSSTLPGSTSEPEYVGNAEGPSDLVSPHGNEERGHRRESKVDGRANAVRSSSRR